MEDSKIKVYTTPSCRFCAMAKDWMRANNIEYEEKDVTEDAGARQAMAEVSGQMGVPVIIVNGEVIVGFNETLLESILKK